LSRSRGMRFTAPQFGHTMCTESFIVPAPSAACQRCSKGEKIHLIFALMKRNYCCF
jgi:hypothetical protein